MATSLRTHIYNNRQAIMNTLGMSFVFSSAMHNARAQSKLEEGAEEARQRQAELDRFKSLLDEEWARGAQERIRGGKTTFSHEVLTRVEVAASRPRVNATDAEMQRTGNRIM